MARRKKVEMDDRDPDGFWNRDNHDHLLRLISVLGSEDRKEYLEIQYISS